MDSSLKDVNLLDTPVYSYSEKSQRAVPIFGFYRFDLSPSCMYRNMFIFEDDKLYCKLVHTSMDLEVTKTSAESKQLDDMLIRITQYDNGIVAKDIDIDTPKKWIECTCLTLGTVNEIDSELIFGDVGTIESIMIMFMSSVLIQIASNKYEYMSTFYSKYQDFPVFIPYKTVTAMDVSKYHLQSTAEMEAKAIKLKN